MVPCLPHPQKFKPMSCMPLISITVKESPNAGVGKRQGSPMACPSCMRLPSFLSVLCSKKLPFQCFKINDQCSIIKYIEKHAPQCDGTDWYYGLWQYMTHKKETPPNNLDIDRVGHPPSIRCRPVVFDALPFRPGGSIPKDNPLCIPSSYESGCAKKNQIR